MSHKKEFTGNRGEADNFFQSAISQGHEGIMTKVLNSPYRAGKRSKFCLYPSFCSSKESKER
ncbi:hypothetical protein KAX35_02625 [candidate division WOR-3 bacterium]|nr:hypothetical protein [candidate division WOR-3 bacterium]